jgi:hypothetical protein
VLFFILLAERYEDWAPFSPSSKADNTSKLSVASLASWEVIGIFFCTAVAFFFIWRSYCSGNSQYRNRQDYNPIPSLPGDADISL